MKNNKCNIIKFIFYPLSFFAIGFLVCYVMFYPMFQLLTTALDLFLSENIPTYTSNGKNLLENDSSKNEIAYPNEGDQFAKIRIDSMDTTAPVYFGDSASVLIKGVGCYPYAGIPGMRKTIIMGAHNNTYFHKLGNVSVGDKISVETNYGDYVYEVTDTQIKDDDDETAYDLYKQEENLILYTCYPFDTLRLTKKRFFVYAKFVSGTQVEHE